MSNDKEIKDKYKDYHRADDIGKARIIKEIDEIQTTNDELDYNFYPGNNDEDFSYNLTRRLEFYHLKSLFNITELSKKCPTDNFKETDPFNFELTNNQQLLRNFMNHKTPYKGLVIFHGVGVGKTCSAVNISRSYRDIFYKDNKKIICLVPKNIRGGWENTIYDPAKGDQQCSGDSFEDAIVRDKKGNIGKKDVKNLIREHYDFYGYLAFANSVAKRIKNEIGNRVLSPDEKEKLERRVIDKHYSHRVLVIDEVHNLREENEMKGKETNKRFRKGDEVFNQERGINVFIIKKEGGEYLVGDNKEGGLEEKVSGNILNHIQVDKSSKEIIEKVIRYSSGLRLILLSATPMFNKSSEIVWLLNLLLKNDNRPTIKKEDVFDGDILKEEGKKILSDKTTGYFSYLRGENPISFPIRFYPDINSDKRCIGGDHDSKITYDEYPKLTFSGERIDKETEGFKFMKMYGSLMTGNQKKTYEKFIDKINEERSARSSGPSMAGQARNNIDLSDRNMGTQLSNIVFGDDSSYDLKDNLGERGFGKTFKSEIKRKSKKCTYLDKDNQILSREKIKEYSTKIHTIIENMMDHKSDGIIFIYSDYIYSGILPLAIALEHIGFDKYSGDNILESSERITPIGYNLEGLTKENNRKAKYIILSGDKSLSPNNEKERNDSLNYNNMNGEKIKVILGNSVTSEGMDFKNIREIHVLDPWYHLYKIEQIIGRGIRYCSHSYHPKKKQNVTVYLHTASSPKYTDCESIDINTYRIAEKKAGEIGEVEKILKANAIDAYLNKDINYITGLKNIKMTTTWRKPVDVDINDKGYTKICSFSDKCNIDINTGKNLEKEIEEFEKKKAALEKYKADLEKYKKLEKDEKLKKNIEKLKKDIEKLEKDIEKDKYPIIDDTFSITDISESIKGIYSIVKELFEIYELYTVKELKGRIKEIIDTDDRIIYHALDEICDDKKIVWNKNNTPGYIINKNELYLFQPHNISDEFVPFLYRSDTKKDNDSGYDKLFRSIKVEFKDVFHCQSSYNEVYQKIKKKYDEELDTDFVEYGNIIKGLKKKHIKDHYMDSLPYDDKVVLLKEILCGFISSGETDIQDVYDRDIKEFFKLNLIYKDDEDNYYGFEETGKVVGFFLCNPEKYNKSKVIFDNFDYYEYDGNWKNLDRIGIGNLRKNIQHTLVKKSMFKTGIPWGYSFKEDKTKHVFKIVDGKVSDKDTEPGKVIGDKGYPMLTLLREFHKNFEENHMKYTEHMKKTLEGLVTKREWDKVKKELNPLNEDPIGTVTYLFKKYKELQRNKKIIGVKGSTIISKEYITKMYELSTRNSFKFLSYDTFLFKSIKPL